ncbi:hypothetical protein GCM10023195_13220 [Actinoallomurus liliacearum]|uniref:Uncharacterized protein n=1 Tax=Actinoallomurus liliacearum TaxID=1080073 RepID=A0ABP8TDY5_9ACTN
MTGRRRPFGLPRHEIRAFLREPGKPVVTYRPAHTTWGPRSRKATFRATGTHEVPAGPGRDTRFRPFSGGPQTIARPERPCRGRDVTDGPHADAIGLRDEAAVTPFETAR